MKTRNGAGYEQAQVEFVGGIGGVMKERNVEVGEIFNIVDVNRIEVELHKTINIIEDQEIVVPGQENANGDVELHAQIDGGDIVYLIIITCYTHPL